MTSNNLTSAEIKSEGWKEWNGLMGFDKTSPDLYLSKKVEDRMYHLVFNEELCGLIILDYRNERLFQGSCPNLDIFKLLSKLVGI